MYCTTAMRAFLERISLKGTISVPDTPSRMVRSRSSSVGRAPKGVVRHLNRPLVKSRGLGSIHFAAGPWPSPLMPWHIMQAAL